MSAEVQAMFSSIAHRYDLANEALSFGMHRRWRSATVRHSGAVPGFAVLDCATGTGDLALSFKRVVGPGGWVVGTDFCAEMLQGAPAKARRAGLQVDFEMGDALALRFPARTFDIASIAFGIRNVDNPVQCLRELSRVVKPGGRVVVLEFGQPGHLFGLAFRLYGRWLMPRIGALLTGNRAAYEYLPRTSAAFPAGGRFLELMGSAGTFSTRHAHRLMFGVAYVYVGVVAG